MPAPLTTRGSLALGCGFKRKNFRNNIQWGFDPHEGFAEVDEDGDVKMPLGFKFKYSIP
jgi:hypothetical protein